MNDDRDAKPENVPPLTPAQLAALEPFIAALARALRADLKRHPPTPEER